MAYLNTKRSALFLKEGATLPVPPANFLELTDEFVVNPNPTVEEFNRVSAMLGGTDSYADTCHVTLSQSISHMMRTNDKGGTALDTVPECAELFKVCAFDEVVSAGTGVTYTNSQAPKKGSAVLNIDGKQFTSTDSIVGNATFTFEIGKPARFDATLSGFLDNEGIPTDQAAPSTTLSTEDLLMMTCTDIFLADGTKLQCDAITIEMGAQVGEKYALEVKEYQITDYIIKLTASFFVDSANYKDAQQKLIDQDVDAIEIKLNTDASGALVDGKSLQIRAGSAKASSYQDSVQDSTVKRSMTWLLRPTGSTGKNLEFTYGTFA